MQKIILYIVTLIVVFVVSSCSEPPANLGKLLPPGPHFKSYMVTAKYPVTSRKIRAAMSSLGKANIRQLDAKTYLVTFYQPKSLISVRAQSTRRLKLFIHPDYGKSSMAKNQVQRNGGQAEREFLITTKSAMTKRQIQTVFRLQGNVVVRKIRANTYLIQFGNKVELRNLERVIRRTGIKQIQPNFKYRLNGI